MNKPVSQSELATPKVTTGPLIGSRKTHVVPEAAPDLRVPLREIVLSKESGEAPLPVYDTSGPYTDPAAHIDLAAGLPALRAAWIAERGDSELLPALSSAATGDNGQDHPLTLHDILRRAVRR